MKLFGKGRPGDPFSALPGLMIVSFCAGVETRIGLRIIRYALTMGISKVMGLGGETEAKAGL